MPLISHVHVGNIESMLVYISIAAINYNSGQLLFCRFNDFP